MTDHDEEDLTRFSGPVKRRGPIFPRAAGPRGGVPHYIERIGTDMRALSLRGEHRHGIRDSGEVRS